MKKMILRGFSLILCLILLAVPVFAEGGSATLSAATGVAGETVTMTVTLKDMPAGDAMGFVVSGLTPTGGSWSKNAPLYSFDTTTGVWAVNDAMDLNGEILTLNFTVPAETTTVSVRVKVLSGEEVVYDKTVSNTITALYPATGLTLNYSNYALTLGGTESVALQATVTPANSTDSVTWSTSDASVATVSGGNVTAVKPGTATITATAGSQSAACTVTVTCAHADLTEVEAKAATCAATGNYLHYICKDCGVTLDADKKVTTASQTIPQLTHTGGTATCNAQAICDNCGQGYGELAKHTPGTAWSSDSTNHYHLCTICNAEKSDVAAHTFDWVIDIPATEDKAGTKHEECSVCHTKRNENTPIDKLDHTHTGITKHEAKAATCAAEGNVEYWTCSSDKCAGKFYADAACQQVLTSIATSKVDHTFGWVTDDPATEDKAGIKHEECSVCHTKRNENTPIDKLDHTHTGITKHEAKAATCVAEGNVEYWTCSSEKCTSKFYADAACQQVLTSIATSKVDHTFGWVTDKAATEKEAGIKHEECSVCHTKRSEDTAIEKLKHAPKLVEGKAATCTESGVIDHFYCANCGQHYAVNDGKCGDKIAKDAIVIPATGHTYDNAYVYDHENHWRYCSCGTAEEAAPHSFDDDQDENCNICDYVRVIAPQIQVENGNAQVNHAAVKDALKDAGSAGVTLETPTADAVELPVAALEEVVNANAALIFEMSDATVTVDAAALAAIADQAEGQTLILDIRQVEAATLNVNQQAAIAGQDVHMTIRAQFICGDQVISDFQGSKVTVSIPFVPPVGTKGTDYQVIYISDDGKVEYIPTDFADNCLHFSVGHFSEYAIVKTAQTQQEPTEAPALPAPEAPAQEGRSFNWIWILVILVLVAIAGFVGFVVLPAQKKRK